MCIFKLSYISPPANTDRRRGEWREGAERWMQKDRGEEGWREGDMAQEGATETKAKAMQKSWQPRDLYNHTERLSQ